MEKSIIDSWEKVCPKAWTDFTQYMQDTIGEEEEMFGDGKTLSMQTLIKQLLEQTFPRFLYDYFDLRQISIIPTYLFKEEETLFGYEIWKKDRLMYQVIPSMQKRIDAEEDAYNQAFVVLDGILS